MLLLTGLLLELLHALNLQDLLLVLLLLLRRQVLILQCSELLYTLRLRCAILRCLLLLGHLNGSV